MKILVAISKVPDTTAKISFSKDNKALDKEGVQFIVNPYDEWYALVRALEFKESLESAEIVVITVGDSSADEVVRKALAIGGDRSIRINLESHDSMNVAFQIAQYAKEENFDLILGGKETISFNGGVVMGMVAEYLKMPYVHAISKLNYEDGMFFVEVGVPSGVETIKSPSSFVASCAKGVAQQRNASMKSILTARRKVIEVRDPKAFTNRVSIESFEIPEPKKGCSIAETPEELLTLLKNEAKAI